MSQLSRAWHRFRALSADWLANGLWAVVSLVITGSMAFDLARMIRLSGGLPPWWLENRGAVSFAGSFILGVGLAVWYVHRARRAGRPRWEAALGAAFCWACSPGWVPAFLFVISFGVIIEIRKMIVIQSNPRVAARYHRYVEFVRAGREGVRDRLEPGNGGRREVRLD